MSGRISLTLEASEMFLSLHMIFHSGAADIWAILESISSLTSLCYFVMRQLDVSAMSARKLIV